jgi:O-acetylserine/cysteine efflux transporter
LVNENQIMSISHIFLAVLVAFIWGINFLFVKTGLDEFSPMVLCALRFFLASIPAIFFVRPPDVPFRIVAQYGLVMFVLQFTLFFWGMYVGMTPGMASLIMQVQVFFSMFFAAVILGERPNAFQILGALVAFGGIGLVGFHFDQEVSLFGFLFILAASATWGFGNLITKKMRNINIIGLVVWGSFVACIPLTCMAFLMDGGEQVMAQLTGLTTKGMISLGYIVYGSTWVGYGVWNYLLSRHAVGSIVPFTLLIPVFGMLSSALVFGEPLYAWKLISAALVIFGLCINLFGSRRMFFKVKTAS